MHGWVFLLLGLGVGAISGVLGIGGGVILVPALVLLFGFSQQTAQGTSLAVLSLPVCLLPALQYYRQGYVEIWPAVWLSLGFGAGAFVTAGFIKSIPTEILRHTFGAVLIFLGVRLIFSADRRANVFVAGLLSCALAWVLFAVFRNFGERHKIRPSLTAALQRAGAQMPADADYQI